ncbi:hypothetical protein BaRGS_00034656 [Batillaria attramentaria]|uniref:Uncharacterized protein n=1 Tax=Batillaria attramentaria TaxID=370345 RepID=A0ABD0JGP7_9CAEN
MCATVGLWLLTGDCDESSGDFTFISPTGNSVVDYFLCNFDLISKCLAQIVQRVESPHMPVVLHMTYMLRTEAGIGEKQRIENFVWDPEMGNDYKARIVSEEGRRILADACDSIDISPDIAMDRFVDYVLYSADCMKKQIRVGGPARSSGAVWYDR